MSDKLRNKKLESIKEIGERVSQAKPRKKLLSPEVRARMKAKDLARRKKIKDFFTHIKDAFKQLDAHRKEKAKERKAYRAGKKVKAKPETEARLERAQEHLQRAHKIQEQERTPETPVQPEEAVQNTAPDENGHSRKPEKPIEAPQIMLPEALKTAKQNLERYIDSPTEDESKNGLNEAKTILAKFDSKSAGLGGVMTALTILILFYLFSRS